MSIIFGILFICSLVVLIAGFKNPEILKNKKTGVVPSRKKIGLIVGSLSFVLLLLLSTTSPSSSTDQKSTTQLEKGCIGPDGKRIGLSPKACEEFNNAWRNEQQTQKLPTPTATPIPSPTPTPTSKPKPVSKVIITPTPVPVVATPAPAPQTDNQNISPVSSETVSQKNAVKSAKSYLGYSAFSHDGLVAQLEYEQFSNADAVYGADNSGGNWNEQAAKAAKSYMEYSAFSRGSLIEQLKYEKFTQEQAEYGASAVGL